jgi:chromosome segregation ATPase
MNPWVTVGLSVLTLILGGGAGATLFKLVAERKIRRVEVADRLSDSSLKWVQEFQEETSRARTEASEARRETSEARRELADMRREMATVRSEAEGLARDLRSLRGAIMAPNQTIERLRQFVDGGAANGRY